MTTTETIVTIAIVWVIVSLPTAILLGRAMRDHDEANAAIEAKIDRLIERLLEPDEPRDDTDYSNDDDERHPDDPR